MRRAKRVAIDYIGVAAGSALVALALDWFLVPNKIAAGGVSGFATVLHYVFGWPVGVVMLAVDAPLFVLSIRYVGLRFGVFTPTEAAVVVAVYALFVATCIYRELRIGDLYEVFVSAALSTSSCTGTPSCRPP